MELRKIIHSESKSHNEPPLTYEEAVDLFKKLDWSDENTFYNQEFGDSYLQLKALRYDEIFDQKEIKVEILLDKNIIKFAATKVTKQEALDLIRYYFEHNEIGDISSYSTEFI